MTAPIGSRVRLKPADGTITAVTADGYDVDVDGVVRHVPTSAVEVVIPPLPPLGKAFKMNGQLYFNSNIGIVAVNARGVFTVQDKFWDELWIPGASLVIF